jgi:hypothetical protein
MGTGKTTLLAAIIENLSAQIQDSKTECVAFFYFQSARRHEQTEAAVLGCLLKQLYKHGDRGSDLPALVRESESRGGVRRPMLHELRSWFSCELMLWEKLTIVLDGLDEVEQSLRYSLLDDLTHNESRNLKILIASRDLPDIERSLSCPATIRIKPNDLSLRRLVAAKFEQPMGRTFSLRMSSKTQTVEEFRSLKHQIELSVLQIANGM